MDKIPYVQNSIDELDVMPILARGSNAAVFHTIGLLLPSHPFGASVRDITKYTGLSEKTISTTVANLQHFGLIEETSGGNYTTAKYIRFPKERNFLSLDDSINLQSKSNQSIQSQSGSTLTEKNFGSTYRALDDALILAGRGMSPLDAEKFRELWDEYPDAELHARALDIMRRKAQRPNFRYYDAVVRTGAVDYDAAKNPNVVEVTL